MKENSRKDYLIPLIVGVVGLALLLLIPPFGQLTWRIYDLFLGLKPGIEEADDFLIVTIDDPTIAQFNMYPLSRNLVADGILTMGEFGVGYLAIDSEFVDVSPRGVREDYLRTQVPNYFLDTFENIGLTFENIMDGVVVREEYSREDVPFLVDDFWYFADQSRDDLLERVQNIARNNDVYLGETARFLGSAHATITPDLGYEEGGEGEGSLSDSARAAQANPDYQALLGDRIALQNITFPQGEHPFLRARTVAPAIFPVMEGMRGAGNVEQHVDEDGVRRRVDIIFEHVREEGSRYYPQLAFSALLEWFGYPELRVDRRSVTLVGAQHPVLGQRDIRIPLDQQGKMILHWPNKLFNDSYRQVTFYDLWENRDLFIKLEDNVRIMHSRQWLSAPLYEGSVPLTRIIDAYEEVLALGMEEGGQDYREEYRQLRDLFLDELENYLGGTALEEIVGFYESLLEDPELGDSDFQAIQDNLALAQEIFPGTLENLQRLRELRERLDQELTDAFVVLGYSGRSTTDIGVNPFEKQYMNVGTMTTVANTIYQEDFLVDQPWWVSFALIFPLGFLIPFIMGRLSPLKGFGVGTGLLLLILGGMFALFVGAGIYLDGLMAIVIFVPTLLTVLLVNFRRSNSQKTFIRSAFGQYLSDDVINELLDDPDKLNLGGESKEMTAIFTDVKGFSTISEKLSAADLVTLLNDYLSIMSDIVLERKGTIDKYEGDAIIAFFGAPGFLPNHAKMACASAVAMKKAEAELNRHFLEQKMSPDLLLTRIGINTGEMVVGNMGTQRKKNYTIMGNAVNLAARLEGVNKQYQTWILTSEYTYNQLEGEYLARRLDRVRVVGIHTPIRLYEIIDHTEMASSVMKEKVEMFEAALTVFEERNYPQAGKQFKEVLKLAPWDGPTQIYLSRCQEYIKNPREDEWDGVYNLTSK